MKKLFDLKLFELSNAVKFSIMLQCIFFQSIQIYSQSQWQWQHPLPTGNTLNSIYFVNDNTGFAAGSMGNIIKTTDKGINWISLNSGTQKEIFKMEFWNLDLGICVCKDGLILITNNGGVNWKQISNYSSLDLYDICIKENKIYVCGLGGKILMSEDHGNTWVNLNSQINIPLFCINFLNGDTGICGGYNEIIRTTNAGISWEFLKADIPFSSQIKEIEYLSPNKIFAAGNSPQGDFYISNNGGDNWERNSLGLPYLFGGSVDLVRSMDFADSNHGCIVTDLGTVLITSTGGKQWLKDTSQRSGFLKEGIFKNVFFKNSSELFLCGNGGRVLKFSDKGNNWNVLSGNNLNFHNSYVTDNGTLFCAGDNGILFRKKISNSVSNLKSEWEKILIRDKLILSSVCFVNDFTGFVCSYNGLIFKTTDGGDNWKEVITFVKQNPDFHLNKIFFKDKYNGFICGGNENNLTGTILKTTNSGDSWKSLFSNFTIGTFKDIHFTDRENGFVVGDNGNLTVTSDGGNTWSTQNLIPYDLNSIDFNGGISGLIVGENGTVFRTSDGGAKWDYISHIQYKDLFSVKFTDSFNVTAVGKNGTVIHSSDAGISWVKMNSLTDNKLLTLNGNNAGVFAFGENGTIICSESEVKVFSTLSNAAPKKNISSLSNYPNPFNPHTNINYIVGYTNNVSIKVYDILGNELALLVNEMQVSGNYDVKFDGSNYASGIYFYAISFNGKLHETKRMVLKK